MTPRPISGLSSNLNLAPAVSSSSPIVRRLSITNTSKVNYCQALPALLSYIPDSVEFEGRLRQAEPSAPPPTTTTPPPLISKSDCAVHTTLPAHNIIPHRPPDGRIALLPQQDHPSHRPALNARLHQRATPICLQLLVLVSQGRQPTAASAPAPSQGELAVQHLLKVLQWWRWVAVTTMAARAEATTVDPQARALTEACTEEALHVVVRQQSNAKSGNPYRHYKSFFENRVPATHFSDVWFSPGLQALWEVRSF
ncbi:hypothetical protein EDB85DRAFT_2278730 [Lactarius pseudohatsudake]|nr:hypothetical protein EDB85DRAFT_2278730 [Lactarius pseudohatsudake]